MSGYIDTTPALPACCNTKKNFATLYKDDGVAFLSTRVDNDNHFVSFFAKK